MSQISPKSGTRKPALFIVACGTNHWCVIRKCFNVTSAASAVDESYICPAPRPQGAIPLQSIWMATPFLRRLQKDLTRSGHLHEPRSSCFTDGAVTLFIDPGSCHAIYWTMRAWSKDVDGPLEP